MMIFHNSNVRLNPDSQTAIEFRQQLIAQLRQMIEPIAQHTSIAMAYRSNAGEEWIISSNGCACWQGVDQTLACGYDHSGEGRQMEAIDVLYEGKNAGSVVLCSGREDKAIQAALRLLVQSVIQHIDPERNEGALALWQGPGQADFDPRAMHLAEALELQQALAIEHDQVSRHSAESERLQQHIEIGSKIQQTLLLGAWPRDFSGLQAAALTVPSQHIDGDFYHFIKHNSQCLDVIVGDVMGKGIPAALLGAATKSHFLRALNRLVSASDDPQLPQPVEIVALTHAGIVKQLIELDSFVTLCYARFDLKQRRIDLVDCGHTKTVHFHKRSGTCQMLQGENVPLGFSEQEIYEQVSVPFESGDLFFFYSDGVTETRNETGEMLGEVRLAELIRTNHQLEPDELIGKIRQQIVAFSDSETFADDLTCVAIKVEEPEAVESASSFEFVIASDRAELARVRALIRDICRHGVRPALDEDATFQLETAVHEAAANIIEHAYHDSSDQRIHIQVDAFSNRLAIRLYDRAGTFDPEKIPPPDLKRERGRGWYIINKYVDEISYSRDDQGRNCLRLVKYLPSPEQEGERHGYDN